MKTLIIYESSHHHNTEKVARAIGEVLNATLVTPAEVNLDSISEYDLIGFGSGIYYASMGKELQALVGRLPPLNKKAFIFSTRGMGPSSLYHRTLRKNLTKKGFVITGEFSCKGWDTIGPLAYVGGINKGRPHEKDLEKAREFAEKLRNIHTSSSRGL